MAQGLPNKRAAGIDHYMPILRWLNQHFRLKVDPLALEFYQTRRRIEDISAFVDKLLEERPEGDARSLTLSLLRRECLAL